VRGLHERSRRQSRAAVAPILLRSLTNLLRRNTEDLTQSADAKRWLADKLVALDPHKAELCYMLCRSIGARRIVEAGTSFGVSTIYLAAAVRDNLASQPDDEAVVIGTEHESNKAAAAHANLEAAGLYEHVRILEGDLRETLKDVSAPVDFMLVDIWIPMALPALKLVTPKLRSGALVVCDNVISGRKRYAEYLAFVRDPNGPFTSITVPGDGGLEISLKKLCAESSRRPLVVLGGDRVVASRRDVVGCMVTRPCGPGPMRSAVVEGVRLPLPRRPVLTLLAVVKLRVGLAALDRGLVCRPDGVDRVETADCREPVVH
jgi:predicted O-methyltransferase YrrM